MVYTRYTEDIGLMRMDIGGQSDIGRRKKKNEDSWGVYRASDTPGCAMIDDGALLCVAEGASMITENIFEDRFMHVPELTRMGARSMSRFGKRWPTLPSTWPSARRISAKATAPDRSAR